MAIIRMRDHLYDEIVNYAKEHLPEEACGLLAGVEIGSGCWGFISLHSSKPSLPIRKTWP